MGIKVEFNPDLALRNIAEFENGSRKIEECIPKNLEAGKVYPFFKKEQRLYWLFGEIPLLETRGNQVLSRPKASVIILEATHFLENREVHTKGRYKVVMIFNDEKVHFDGFDRIK
ncbi:MAG: hypothetical protein PHW31_04065 [Candidatus Pacebacteria bacterium]|nr:hypothetical protein [Candidatus Paceibacterota bacterium]